REKRPTARARSSSCRSSSISIYCFLPPTAADAQRNPCMSVLRQPRTTTGPCVTVCCRSGTERYGAEQQQ
uniref:Uncharacterized protein n=1 Tax=Anopheles minimus TaxID=112268 RepID=A0A182WMT9_9DIPT